MASSVRYIRSFGKTLFDIFSYTPLYEYDMNLGAEGALLQAKYMYKYFKAFKGATSICSGLGIVPIGQQAY